MNEWVLNDNRELEYHLLLARDLSFLGDVAYRGLEGQVVEVKRMLTGFIERLRTEPATEN
jgi:four helix bundle protein